MLNNKMNIRRWIAGRQVIRIAVLRSKYECRIVDGRFGVRVNVLDNVAALAVARDMPAQSCRHAPAVQERPSSPLKVQ